MSDMRKDSDAVLYFTGGKQVLAVRLLEQQKKSVGQQLSAASVLIGSLLVAALLFSALGLLFGLFSLLFC